MRKLQCPEAAAEAMDVRWPEGVVRSMVAQRSGGRRGRGGRRRGNWRTREQPDNARV